ncbi:hypothetical protein E2C01_040735 [Portunus trituberculatus]|uniref:Uncharacterized protein n=1 Tax=Portunus trituberculatus TaxID=210409 RepID=A0A5B7FI69_PORTR|nr:hypothetical protein [Portunus trituberculatus]
MGETSSHSHNNTDSRSTPTTCTLTTSHCTHALHCHLNRAVHSSTVINTSIYDPLKDIASSSLTALRRYPKEGSSLNQAKNASFLLSFPVTRHTSRHAPKRLHVLRPLCVSISCIASLTP